MKSQEQTILEFLQTGQAITPMLAYEMFSVLACHSRISALRKLGHPIACRIVTREGKRWGEYRLLHPAPQQ